MEKTRLIFIMNKKLNVLLVCSPYYKIITENLIKGASEVLKSLFPSGLTPPNDIAAASAKILSLHKTSSTISKDNPFTRQAMIAKTIGLYEKNIAKKQP